VLLRSWSTIVSQVPYAFKYPEPIKKSGRSLGHRLRLFPSVARGYARASSWASAFVVHVVSNGQGSYRIRPGGATGCGPIGCILARAGRSSQGKPGRADVDFPYRTGYLGYMTTNQIRYRVSPSGIATAMNYNERVIDTGTEAQILALYPNAVRVEWSETHRAYV
jgi:hypothetical protein